MTDKNKLEYTAPAGQVLEMHHVQSSSDGLRVLKISGLDENGQAVSEKVTMYGTEAVHLGKVRLRGKIEISEEQECGNAGVVDIADIG